MLLAWHHIVAGARSATPTLTLIPTSEQLICDPALLNCTTSCINEWDTERERSRGIPSRIAIAKLVFGYKTHRCSSVWMPSSALCPRGHDPNGKPLSATIASCCLARIATGVSHTQVMTHQGEYINRGCLRHWHMPNVGFGCLTCRACFHAVTRNVNITTRWCLHSGR